MKKGLSSKRSGPGSPRGGVTDLKKPFGFCCDVKNQDPETRYDIKPKKAPFESSMSNIFLNGGGPDLKFRIQDIGKCEFPTRRREERRRISTNTSLGECRRCRGPLKWYLEDEISLARDLLASDKQAKYNSDAEKHLLIAIAKKRRNRRSGRDEKLTKMKRRT